MNKSFPLVSICVQTYQHVDYIKECLDSILSQKTDFTFEILLGEDCSNDGTREICIEYAEKHPDKINLFLHSRDTVIYINDHATGRYNFLNNLSHAKGKYIALCEGDDYWTDPGKLQQQVDFLEKNNDFSICYHDVSVLENGQFSNSHVPVYEKEFLTIVDLAQENCIHTPTCVFRNNLYDRLPDFVDTCPALDYPLHMINAQYGKIKHFQKKMAVYRRHAGGIWAGRQLPNKLNAWLDVLSPLILYFKDSPEVQKNLQKQHLNTLLRLIKTTLSTGNKEQFVDALKKAEKWEFEHIAQYMININEELITAQNNYANIDFLINHISIKNTLKLLLKKTYYKVFTNIQ